ncbi:MAG: hypothetical protein DRO13_01430 [Thermoprotei archaeon]|nr:MAG: hypothetical protein DRO13_01430 [Thermoprotei archaeon]
MKILICTVKSDIVYYMTKFLTYLFPSSEYYVVSLIRTMKHRVMMTKLYMKTVEKTLTEAQDIVEAILRSNRITSITKDIVYGNKAQDLLKYAEKHAIDLIAITPRATHNLDRLGRFTEKIIKESRIPILLYTWKTDPIIVKKRVINIAKIGNPPSKILNEISKNHDIKLVALDKTSSTGNRLHEFDIIFIDKESFLKTPTKYLWIVSIIYESIKK